MRCPKCHYLSFDPEPRCRNCGYDLEVADDELALKAAEPPEPSLPDLKLRERPGAPAFTPLPLEIVRLAPDTPSERTRPRFTITEDSDVSELAAVGFDELDPDLEPEAPPPPVAPAPREPMRPPFRAPHTTAELPLFVKGISDNDEFPDEGRLGRGPVPILPPSRPPLAVRRGAPAPPTGPVQVEPAIVRPAAARRLGPLDRDLLEDLKRVEHEEAMRVRDEARAAGYAVEVDGEPVEPGRRAGAAAIDVAMLGSIAAFVFWATLKVCAINLTDLDAAALIPLVFFIVVMDVTYLLMFTAAGGQTIGKMAMGIRVIGDEAADGGPVSLQHAAWRAALTVISLGLGWLPALFGRGIALHDRFAHTRVVRA